MIVPEIWDGVTDLTILFAISKPFSSIPLNTEYITKHGPFFLHELL